MRMPFYVILIPFAEESEERREGSNIEVLLEATDGF